MEARDTPGDVGTVINTAAEGQRGCERAVVVAAAKRLAEAVRCLEEYSKIDYGKLAGGFESIRYQGYELEKQLLLRKSWLKNALCTERQWRMPCTSRWRRSTGWTTCSRGTSSISQTVAVSPQERYRLSVWGKYVTTPGGNYVPIEASIAFYNGTDRLWDVDPTRIM